MSNAKRIRVTTASSETVVVRYQEGDSRTCPSCGFDIGSATHDDVSHDVRIVGAQVQGICEKGAADTKPYEPRESPTLKEENDVPY